MAKIATIEYGKLWKRREELVKDATVISLIPCMRRQIHRAEEWRVSEKCIIKSFFE